MNFARKVVRNSMKPDRFTANCDCTKCWNWKIKEIACIGQSLKADAIRI